MKTKTELLVLFFVLTLSIIVLQKLVKCVGMALQYMITSI